MYGCTSLGSASRQSYAGPHPRCRTSRSFFPLVSVYGDRASEVAEMRWPPPSRRQTLSKSFTFYFCTPCTISKGGEYIYRLGRPTDGPRSSPPRYRTPRLLLSPCMGVRGCGQPGGRDLLAAARPSDATLTCLPLYGCVGSGWLRSGDIC